MLEYTVPPESGGKKLNSVLRNDMLLSASMVRRLKHVNGIKLNGANVYADHIVMPDDVISLDVSLPRRGPVLCRRTACLTFLMRTRALSR
jgi:23S rRNA-/tRNA-specific pseudouridylate synthase